MTAACGAVLAVLFERSLASSVPSLARLLRMHALSPALAVLLVGAVALGMLLLLAVSAGAGYASLVRPSRLKRRTRYFVTNARVLIRRGNEELALDRSRIAYVIDAPSRKLHDVFLVLDGPQARALAPSGAFGGDRRATTRCAPCSPRSTTRTRSVASSAPSGRRPCRGREAPPGRDARLATSAS